MGMEQIMIANLKINNIATVLSVLWNNKEILSTYISDAQYRAVFALCMPRLQQIHAHDSHLLGSHLLSFSEFNLVKVSQRMLDEGLVAQLTAELVQAEKTGAQLMAEELVRAYEGNDISSRVR